jgi:hypothetical protein
MTLEKKPLENGHFNAYTPSIRYPLQFLHDSIITSSFQSTIVSIYFAIISTVSWLAPSNFALIKLLVTSTLTNLTTCFGLANLTVTYALIEPIATSRP